MSRYEVTTHSKRPPPTTLERWIAIRDSGFALGGIRILSCNLGRRKGEAAEAWDCGFINRLYLDGMCNI